ncbi:hypothetical protein BJF84_15835 [Rhodococcus sp. CUA-806]|nr:hypothetical protein BJF84_15835 [Rhodococcus sp. CUA-806]
MTVAEFLDENPGSDAVQLRRVSAINRAHRDAGHPLPGRVTSMRLALDSVRAERIRRRGSQLRSAAAALSATGSTEALFGRRDVVLLLFASGGLSFTAIADLGRTDVTVDGPDVWIGGSHRIRIPLSQSDGAISPAQLWQRWEAVLQFSDRYPSTALLAEQLQRGSFPDMGEWPHRAGPVAVPIDRWGHMPFPPTAMAPDAVAAVVRAHLAGAPPRRTTRPARRSVDEQPNVHTAESVVHETISVDLDPGYYERGIAARRRAHAGMADVPDLVDDVEGRIEALLQRTLDLLDSVNPNEL